MSELKSNSEWRQWGKEDPLWGVASWADKQKDGASPWTEAEFYSLGESDWSDFEHHWNHYGVNRSSCLEIGCGAGRLTRQLSKYFDRLIAVDVSPDMIACARKAIASDTVDFLVIDGMNIPYPSASVDAVFSAHVLQHLDSEEIGHAYFREFFRLLKANGTLMVHLPLYQFPNEKGSLGLLMRSQHVVFRSLSNTKASVHRILGAKLMRGTQYSVNSLNVFLTDVGFRNVEFRIFPVRSNADLHPFVLATK
jgi:ubiquinone/menaquinone biosynthesis C-methylase UbiE